MRLSSGDPEQQKLIKGKLQEAKDHVGQERITKVNGVTSERGAGIV